MNLKLTGFKFDFPIRFTPGPAGLKYAKTVYNLLLLAKKGQKVDWDRLLDLKTFLQSEYLPLALKGAGQLSDAALKRFCEERWRGTTETP